MNPIGARHLACVVAPNHLLVALSGGRYFVSVQNPISVDVGDEPQPDLSLLKERPRPDAEAPPARRIFCWWSRSRTARSPMIGT